MHLCVLLYTFNVIKREINIVFSVTLVLKSHFMWMGIRINDDDDDDPLCRPPHSKKLTDYPGQHDGDSASSFSGTLLTIQCLSDWSAFQSLLGALLKSTSLSLPDVFLSARRLPATQLHPK